MTEDQKRILEEQTNLLLESGTVIRKEDKDKLDTIYSNIDSFLLENKNARKESHDIDALYGTYKEMMIEYYATLKATNYLFTVSEKEFKFIKKVVCRELKYGRQEVFVGLLVRNEYLKTVDETSFPKNGEGSIESNIDHITRLSYLIGKYEVQGLDESAELFASVVEKMGSISRVFQVFNDKGDEIAERAANWVQGLEPEEAITPGVEIPVDQQG